jgi:cation diffusion facilitator family transporter
MPDPSDKGIRAAQLGILVNALLAVTKLLAGVVGNSYALVADAVESATDIFSSLIVMGGLWIARRDPTDEYPFGFGRAETLATAVVALMLVAVAVGIAIEAIREILTPHHLPAPWTLGVLALVVIVKALISRRVQTVGAEIGSTAVTADAQHHLSDAFTSTAAFIGISVALWGGKGWEQADDWAALVAAAVIAFNGIVILRTALRDLMDAAPTGEIIARIRQVAESVPNVLAVEKLHVRRSGMVYQVAIHVQASPSMPLSESHALSGHVKAVIQEAIPQVARVLVHMEPFVASGATRDEPQ